MPMIPWFSTWNKHENLRANYDYINKDNEIKYVDEFMEEVNQNKTSPIIFDDSFFDDFRVEYSKNSPTQKKEDFKSMAKQYTTIQSIEFVVANETNPNKKLQLFDVEVFLTFQKIDQLAKTQGFEQNLKNDIKTQEEYQNAVLEVFQDIDLNNRKNEIRDKVGYWEFGKYEVDWLDGEIYVLHGNSESTLKTFVYVDPEWIPQTVNFVNWEAILAGRKINMFEEARGDRHIYKFWVIKGVIIDTKDDWSIVETTDNGSTITNYDKATSKKINYQTTDADWNKIFITYDENEKKLEETITNPNWGITTIKYKDGKIVEEIIVDNKWVLIDIKKIDPIIWDDILEEESFNLLKDTEAVELTNAIEIKKRIEWFRQGMLDAWASIPDNLEVEYLFSKTEGEGEVYSIKPNKSKLLENTKERTNDNLDNNKWFDLLDIYTTEELDELKNNSNYINETHISNLTNKYFEQYTDYNIENDRIMKIIINWEEQYILLWSVRKREVTARVIDNQIINKVKIATTLGLAYNKKLIDYIEVETGVTLTNTQKTEIINAEGDSSIEINGRKISFIFPKKEIINWDNYNDEETIDEVIQQKINEMDDFIKINVIID